MCAVELSGENAQNKPGHISEVLFHTHTVKAVFPFSALITADSERVSLSPLYCRVARLRLCSVN